MKELRSMWFTGDYTKEVRDCPNLECLCVIPSLDFGISLSSLPNIRELFLGIVSISHLEQNFQKFVKDIMPFCPNLHTFGIFSSCPVDDIKVNGSLIPEDSKIGCFQITVMDQIKIERINVEDFYTITEFTVGSNTHFPKVTLLKNLPKLLNLDYSSWNTLPIGSVSGSNLTLENLESLGKISVSLGFTSLERVVVNDCPNLRIIEVDFSYEPKEGNDYLRYELQFDGRTFPHVEEIHVLDFKVIGGANKKKIQRIGRISNMKKLKKIVVKEGIRFNVETIVRETRGINTDEVMIESDWFVDPKKLSLLLRCEGVG